MQVAIPDDLEPKTLAALQDYTRGVSIQTIAAEHGVDRGTIYDWMLAGLGKEQYNQLITRALVRRVATADEQLEGAEEPHHIARAREVCRFARMDLERRRPELYGQKSHLTVEHTGDLGNKIRKSRERVIDGSAERVVGAQPCIAASPESDENAD